MSPKRALFQKREKEYEGERGGDRWDMNRVRAWGRAGVIYLVRVVIVQRAQTTWISREGARTHISRGCRVKSHVHFRLCETEGMKSLSASLTHYCLGKHSTGGRRDAHGGEEKKQVREFYSENSLLNIRSRPNFEQQLWWCAAVRRSSAPGCQTRSGDFGGYARVGKTIPLFQSKRKENPST